jgi:hypothetical protein
MKKIFMILLCVLMIVAVPTVAFATSEAEEIPDKTITEVEMTITERVVEYVKENAEGILAVIASIGSAILVKLITSKISNSVTTLNNNSIEIAKNSDESLKTTAKENKAYAAKIQELLDKYEKSEEEKKLYAEALVRVETFLKTAKLATLELSNEVAELLVLANIPNSRKEELYARHKNAVHEIESAEGVINSD